MTQDILVVEDDKTMRELLGRHLALAGYSVRTAADGLEAGRAILDRTPALIIADVYMPNMNGFELVSAIREDPAHKDIPVIFLTIDGDSAERGARLGAVEYLSKPILLDKLLRKVEKHLPPGG